MKIGIGIDTGGTCTDAVIYNFEKREILAYAKTHTTKDDLSRGIYRVLDKLPRDLVEQADVVALSTTLATNACVENKGGRAKLLMFGIDPATVKSVGEEYGLSIDDSLCFIDSKTKPSGEIVNEPDWDDFIGRLNDRFGTCDALGLVEMYAKKTGARLEKHAQKIINNDLGIPAVCGHELFSENNIVKRGASVLLNARLIPVIENFLDAVKKALKEHGIKAPFVIVRSDGSLMTEKFTATHPVETLLCGPVSSVMGAVELTDEKNCMIIDIGGTTTDIAFVKNGTPQRVKSGVRIGKWNTFVKGLFVDTFGLGGDSGVVIKNKEVALEDEKIMPLCMAAHRYPKLLAYLQKEDSIGLLIGSQQKDIYLGIKNISDNNAYTENEKRYAAALFKCPQSLETLSSNMGDVVLKSHLERLIREGIIIRCGITPTDVMHIKGDFIKYSRDASVYGVNIMARIMRITPDELCEQIYDEVKRKLYFNILRIMIEDTYPQIKEKGIGEQLEILINDSYKRAKSGENNTFLGFGFSTPASLVGVGAPTHIFLKDVGKLLGTKVVTSEYSKVANALGAVVGKVSVSVSIEVAYNKELNCYTVFGRGERHNIDNLDEAKKAAIDIASKRALEEAINRGSDDNTTISLETNEDIVDTDFGSLYMGYKVTATASGNLKLVS